MAQLFTIFNGKHCAGPHLNSRLKGGIMKVQWVRGFLGIWGYCLQFMCFFIGMITPWL